MTPPRGDGTAALPLVVVGFLLVDVVAKMTAVVSGADPGGGGLVSAAQSLLVTAAAGAAMARRPQAAVVLAVVVAALALTAGPCGTELWLVLITGVTVAARGSWRQTGLVLLGQVAYAAGFGWVQARTLPGSGLPSLIIVLGLAAAGLAVGLVARRLLQVRDRRRQRLVRLERERASIRATERARLADELQTVATQGLVAIQVELDGAASRPDDPARLRHGLSEVDRHCRSVLAQLRTLLDALRGDHAAEPEDDPAGRDLEAGRRVAYPHLRQVRLAATVVLGALAVHAALQAVAQPSDAGARVQCLGLVACAAALWWPRVGAAIAGTALLSSATAADPTAWDAVAVGLLCLLGAARLSPRRVWLVLFALAAYGVLVALVDPSGVAGHLVLTEYLGVVAVATGLALRYFVTARTTDARRLGGLLRERERVGSEERTAVARELHDLVAHQLSVTTMLLMAASASEDPRTLTATLDRVRRSTGAARSELDTLLATMRSPAGEVDATISLASPLGVAAALARQLSEHGFDPVLDLDPAAGALTPTTARTLNRIMQEATTNILRYAPARSRCRYTLATEDGAVRLRIVSELPDDGSRSDLSLGWGLRGVRERVDLTGGTFGAGPDQGCWVLAVTLPADTAAGISAVTAAAAGVGRP